MNINSLYQEDTVWSMNNYKIGYKTIRMIPSRYYKHYDEMVDSKVERLRETENLHVFLKGIQNKEFRLLPYRVFGDENDEKARLFMQSDVRHNSFTLYSKLAYITLFIFEMVDTRVQNEPFVQISLERFYSKEESTISCRKRPTVVSI